MISLHPIGTKVIWLYLTGNIPAFKKVTVIGHCNAALVRVKDENGDTKLASFKSLIKVYD